MHTRVESTRIARETQATPIRILLVEDEARIAEIVRRGLTEQSFVVVAGDGPSALARALDTRPDLVILDVMLPSIDGFVVCSATNSTPLGAAVFPTPMSLPGSFCKTVPNVDLGQ